MPIAINIRGTSGSGKTTLVRSIMGQYHSVFQNVYRENRRRPIVTIHQHKPGCGNGIDLAVIGHYEAPCGGCDTITELDDVFRLVREQMGQGRDVLFEGLILSGEIARTAELAKEVSLHIFCLTTPLEQCLANVNGRRAARGQMLPVKPANTKAKMRCVELTMQRLDAMDVLATSRWGTYDECLGDTRLLLNVT